MDGHNFNKKELIPIAALLIFIVIVLILCAVSAGRDAATMQEDTAAMQEGVEGENAVVLQDESGIPGTAEQTEGTLTEVKETVGFEEDAAAESTSSDRDEVSAHQIEPAIEEEGRSEAVSGNGVNGNTVTVQKTNVEMLAEMMDYWSRGNVEAVEDLSGLSHYRSMSDSLQGPSYFYYYGDRNGEGRPDGTGIAVYGEDQYYYGQWSDGVRSGEGSWLKMYYDSDPDRNSDRALISHSYTGSWQNNLPNGEGHEQYGIDIKQAQAGSRYWQNMMGEFRDGLYDGEMYIVTIDAGGNVQEWYGSASQGVFETFGGRDQEGRVPICQDAKNPDSHLWIRPLDNMDLGLTEVREQVTALRGN